MLLPRYAAGDLTMADAEAVRAHLTSGCADCLDALYRMPVGMPRDVARTASARAASGGAGAGLPAGRVPAPAGPARGAASSWVVRALVLAVTVTLIVWAAAAWSGSLG